MAQAQLKCNNDLIPKDSQAANTFVDTSANINPADFRYYPLARNWTKIIKPVFESAEAQAILFRDYKKYIKGKQHNLNKMYGDNGEDTRVSWNYKKKDMPRDWDSVDWRYDRVGRPPAYDQYVCWGGCHWVVNTLLYTACEVYPETDWRIITSDMHSTVWDGGHLFFDLNYMALKLSSEECCEYTLLHPGHRVLKVRQYLYLF